VPTWTTIDGDGATGLLRVKVGTFESSEIVGEGSWAEAVVVARVPRARKTEN
jgi:hypothetical protein